MKNIKIISNCLFSHVYGRMDLQIISQLTKCTFKNRIFYVREAFNNIPSILLNSNSRIAHKTRRIPIQMQCLEICCHKDDFDYLSSIVRKFDALNRPVSKNKFFTYKWAEKTIHESIYFKYFNS